MTMFTANYTKLENFSGHARATRFKHKVGDIYKRDKDTGKCTSIGTYQITPSKLTYVLPTGRRVKLYNVPKLGVRVRSFGQMYMVVPGYNISSD